MSSRSASIVVTSRIRGTFVSCTGSLASTQAASTGRTPFLFPEARTLPPSGWPPSITKAWRCFWDGRVSVIGKATRGRPVL